MLAICFLGLALLSPRFAWHIPQAERPTFLGAGLLLIAGAAFAALRWSQASPSQRLLGVLVTGGVLRLLMLGSTPIWEDDFYRYLWDGGASLAGLNPFVASPANLQDSAFLLEHPRWAALARADADLLAHVSYPYYRTIYPGVAQLAFAVGHALSGGDLFGLRMVLLGGDVACLILLLRVLNHLGLSAMWVGLYWLNPVIAKEFINSAHVDALLGPLIIGGVWAALHKRPGVMGICLGLAAGIKLWPILLWPLLARYGAQGRWRAALLSAGAAGVIAALSIAPLLLAGLDRHAGLTAFAGGWVRNSAWHPLYFAAVEEALRATGLLQSIDPSRLARGLLGLAALGASLAFALRAKGLTPSDLLSRAFSLCALILLISPTQFPWYLAVTLPLAVLARRTEWACALALAAPAYYLRFALDQHGLLANALAWAGHCLLWGALLYPRVANRQGPLP